MSRLLDDLSSLAGRRNKAIPHYNLGLTSLGNKNYPSAINYFIRALKEDDTGENTVFGIISNNKMKNLITNTLITF